MPALERVVARTLGALLAAVLAALLIGAVATPAAADDLPDGCHLEAVGVGEDVTYVVVCPGTGPGEDDGDGGSASPTCELTGLATYCIGTSACWANVPSALDPATWPEETRPSPEAIYTYQSCDPDPDGTLTDWSWYEPPGPSLAELATQAYGALAAPAFTLGFSPPGRAVVGVETWFWAQTGAPGEIVGSSAAGVVAIGRPDALEVDPGDGSGVRTCAWTTTAEATCVHVYTQSSAGGAAVVDGQPAHAARMRLVYDIRFELDGAPLNLPGLPTTFSSPWRDAAVPVAEIQSVVTSG